MRCKNNGLTRSQRRGSRYFTVNSAQHHTTRTNWDLSSIKVKLITAEKLFCRGCLGSITSTEHRPPRRTVLVLGEQQS
jgi:hypothetical protein